MANTVEDFEALLLGICEQHGFTSVTIGLHAGVPDDQRFCAFLHYADQTEGNGCSHGYGASITAALNAANRDALTKRPTAPLIREAA